MYVKVLWLWINLQLHFLISNFIFCEISCVKFSELSNLKALELKAIKRLVLLFLIKSFQNKILLEKKTQELDHMVKYLYFSKSLCNTDQ